MWIETTNPAHFNGENGGAFADERVLDERGEPVQFSTNGKAQVSQELGEYLVDEYDDFKPSDAEPDEDVDESDEDADDESETDEEDT